MPYRDDQSALESRRDDLRHELSGLRTRVEELEGLVGQEEALRRELASIEERLLRAATRRLPLLDSLRIASPCSADWNAMKGDDHVRFCGECSKNVYNLSALPRAEAEQLLAEREGDLCVRLYKRADGTVLTADCPVGVRRRRFRRIAFAVAGAGAMAAGAMALWARTRPAMSSFGGVDVGTDHGFESVAGGIRAPPEPTAEPKTVPHRPHIMGARPPRPLPPAQTAPTQKTPPRPVPLMGGPKAI